jgi:hypothetical protein
MGSQSSTPEPPGFEGVIDIVQTTAYATSANKVAAQQNITLDRHSQTNWGDLGGLHGDEEQPTGHTFVRGTSLLATRDLLRPH